ncbi:LrgB family protein [Hansschlegelia plantiphila]|uniref:Membrane protein n=1 Tax=Hansschlegelia plantiphila TaxID=374655 RepID=A0A9W6J5U8_9HYPH|nr:LrgB family protein [Hansschlegelia plantiphila]GLK69848.1 membrane protein [Hansschlegelia plantiphila]
MTTPQSERFFELWVFLSTSPLLWLTVTIGAFLTAQRIAALAGGHPIVNPVLLSIIAIVVVLKLTGTDYRSYFEGAQFVHFALGPATVALGVSLFRNRALVRHDVLPIAAALLVGAPVACLSVVLLARAFGLGPDITLALAPKSVTVSIALGIANEIHADPGLTAVFAIATGITGAVIVTPLMNALGIRDYAARGFAAGLASHGIGTARAFQVDDAAGAFAGLAMALNAVLTALLAPVVLALLMP